MATLLDEAMTNLAGFISLKGAVTAEMTVRYLKSAPIGEKLFVQGEIVSESRKLLQTKASIRDGRGMEIARASGKVMRL